MALIHKAIAILLMEEEDDEDEMIFNYFFTNEKEDPLFQARREEGAYHILIQRHLFSNDIKFKEYFRLSIGLFEEVVSLISGDVSSKFSNRRGQPISVKEKLCLTLR